MVEARLLLLLLPVMLLLLLPALSLLLMMMLLLLVESRAPDADTERCRRCPGEPGGT